MFNLSNLKLRNKFLLIPFSDFIIITIILASILAILYEYKSNLQNLSHTHLSAIKINGKNISLLIETHNHLYTLIKNAPKLDEEQIYNNSSQIFQDIKSLQEKINKQKANVKPNEYSTPLVEINNELNKYLIIAKEITEMSSVDVKLAISYYDDANSQFIILNKLFMQFQDAEWEHSDSFLKKISEQTKNSITIFLLISMVLMIVVISIAILLSKVLSKELLSLINIMDKLSHHKIDEVKHIPYLNKTDEIGLMAHSVNNFKNTLEQLDVSTKDLIKSEKMAAMGEMIGNIAHQWRQPLSTISTVSSSMQLQKELEIFDDNDLIKNCKIISDSAQFLSITIDDFRNFIKGDRTKEIFNLKITIDSFLNLVKSSITSHNLNIVLDLDKDVQINGYKNELLQCIINIFNNAKDVLDEKIPKDKKRFIFITTKQKDENAILTIKDNGYGIPKDILSKIFEPYFTTKHQSQGTGLGLHMTYNLIIEGMAGTIEASNQTYRYDDKEYTGAQFTITLPLSS